MAIVLAHGALGYWDEALSLTLIVCGLFAGVAFALLKGATSRGATLVPEDDPAPNRQPLVKADAKLR